jgi:general secretion pathway protein I
MVPDRPDFRSKGGFTLVEVLVALAIFALASVVLGLAYLNVLRGYAAVRRGTGQDQDVAFARQELLAQPNLQLAETGDQYDTADGGHVQWTAEIDPTTTTDLFTVTLTAQVPNPNGPGPRTVTQTFMLLRPTWSAPADRTALRQAAANRIAQIQGKQK